MKTTFTSKINYISRFIDMDITFISPRIVEMVEIVEIVEIVQIVEIVEMVDNS